MILYGWILFLLVRGGFSIFEVARLEQIPLMLAYGRADLVINSSSWINWWAEKKGVQDQIQEYDFNWPWTRFHFVFMLSKKSNWVEKGLTRTLDEEEKKMKNAGVWHNLLKKYKNPHGFGKPFTSHIDEKYEQKYGFYTDYDNYPIYKPIGVMADWWIDNEFGRVLKKFIAKIGGFWPIAIFPVLYDRGSLVKSRGTKTYTV